MVCNFKLFFDNHYTGQHLELVERNEDIVLEAVRQQIGNGLYLKWCLSFFNVNPISGFYYVTVGAFYFYATENFISVNEFLI